mgnify:CR=1 FL=1
MLEPGQLKVCKLIEDEIVEEFLALGSFADVKTIYISLSALMPDSMEMLDIIVASISAQFSDYDFDIKFGVFKILPKDEYFFKFSKDKHYNEFQRKVPKIELEEEDTYWNF